MIVSVTNTKRDKKEGVRRIIMKKPKNRLFVNKILSFLLQYIKSIVFIGLFWYLKIEVNNRTQ